jgi:putative membrane protein
MMMSGEHGLFFGGGFMWIIWLILIIGLVYIIKGITSGNASGDPGSYQESPREILDKRLARGEIDSEEYARLREELEK